jgi:hypothetical protein
LEVGAVVESGISFPPDLMFHPLLYIRVGGRALVFAA